MSSTGILIVYNKIDEKVQISEHNLIITKYHPMTSDCFKFQDSCYKIEFLLLNHPHHINITISEIMFNMENSISVTSKTCDGFNKVTIINCNFTNIISTSDLELAAIIDVFH